MKKITLLLLLLLLGSVKGYSQLYGQTENFDGGVPSPTGALPQLWGLPTGAWAIFERNTPATVVSTQTWGINAFAAGLGHNNTECASINRENTGINTTTEDWLATSQVDVPLTGSNELHFWTRLFASGNQGTTFKVMWAPAVATQADPNSYTDLQQWSELNLILPVTDFNVWTEKTVPLPSFLNGQSIYIAFVKIYPNTDGSLNGERWLIDDVSVNTQCTAPVPGATGAITTSTANLTWTNPGNATSFQVVVTPTAGGTPLTFNFPAPAANYPITGLASNTTYTYTVTGVCSSGFSSPASVVSAPFTTQIAPPVCGGNLVDSGGVAGNYSNNENISLTVPPTTGNVVSVTFTAFNTQAGSDILTIYNGPDTSSPVLATLSGTTLPGTYTSTAPQGQLTFVFQSNGTTTAAGYAANIICNPAPACRIPHAVIASGTTTTGTTITWTQPTNPDSSVATVFDVIALPQGSPAPNAGSVPTFNDVTAAAGPSFTLTGLTPATCYDIYVRAVCAANSGWSVIPTTVCTLVAPPVCGGNYVDTGGTGGNYPNNVTQPILICPGSPTDAVTLTFTAFNIAAGDTLQIYDGDNASATLLATLSGTTLPPSFTSSAASGCLYAVFTSNATGNAAGWLANVTCAPKATCAAPTVLTNPATLHNSATLTWIQPANPDGSTSNVFDIFYQPCGQPAPTAGSTPQVNDVTVTGNPSNYVLTGLSPLTCYDIYVRAVCGSGGSVIIGPITTTTLAAPPECGGNFVDAGGTTAAYAPNSNITTVICPTTPGDVVTVTFTAFNTEANFDALYVYNGNAVVPGNIIPSNNPAGSVPGGLAGGYWGTAIPCPFTSSDANGCLTFVFRSDGSVQNPGWLANVTCGPPPPCRVPTAISSTANTFNSITLTWTQPVNPDTTTASAWQVLALPCGSPAPLPGATGFVDVTTAPPFTLPNLSPATCYDIYVRANCGTSVSAWPCTPVTVTTPAAPPVCGGNFVDAGGTTAAYAANSNITTTICPTTPGEIVTVTFTSFNTEANFDALYVYNGNAVVPGNLIPSNNPAGSVPGGLAGGYWGTTIPCSFISASADGCLTFVFRSDGSVQNAGWVANITCGPPASCAVPAVAPATNVTHNSAVLNWTQPANADTSVATAWQILPLPCGSPAPLPGATGFTSISNPPTAAPPYTLTGLTPSTCYDVYIRANCGTSTSAWTCTPITFTTLVAPPECGGVFVDAGGPTGNYAASSNITTIICPGSPGEIVTVTFTTYQTEVNFDALYVYDGNTVNPATQIASTNPAGAVPGGLAGGFWGTELPGPFTSTSPDGCLTFVFRSDPSVQQGGWTADITCAPAPTCARPVLLNATFVSQTSATLGWTQLANPDGSFATNWEYLILPAGSPIPTGSGIPVSAPGAPPIVQNGLAPGTAYVFYVRAMCDGTNGSSTWSALNFATLPTNDECANAIFAIVNQNLNCVQTTHGTLAGATASSPATTCGGAGAANDDVWFTFTATTVTHVISFNNVTPANAALSYAVYQGTCSGLTEVGCNSGANLVAGTTYYIRVFSNSTLPQFTNFDLCIGTLPCTEAPAFCTGQTVTYANSTNVPSLGQIGCLFTSPNPAFFFLQVNQAGPLSYLITQVDTGGTPRDVDYVAWGPFTDLNTACTGVPANPLGQTVPIPTPTTGCPGTLHACSYSAAPEEIMCIPNAQLCEVYVIMITNFSNQPGTVTFTQTNTNGGTTACFPINTFNYPQTYYCQNQPDTTPVLSPGASAGVYTSTPGLDIDPVTGTIHLATSTPGNYIVTSTSATTIGGTCNTIPFITTTRTVIITAPAAATITYPGAPYCKSIITAQAPTRTGTPGGTYSSTTGLVLNAISGEIIPVASEPGVYTVTYTIPATGGCPAFTTDTQVEILASPVITQTSVTACDTFTLPTLTEGGYFTSAGGVGPIDATIPITATQSLFIYAQGTNGCISEKPITVTINSVPTPTFTVTQSSCTSPTGSITVTSPTSPGGATPLNLFISEVTDADTGSLTYVELYNATGAPVNLANYKLKFYTWGAPPTAENLQCDLVLAGTIPNNATNVIKVSNNANIAGVTPNQTFASCAGVNNNDNIRLTTASDVLVDQWGPTDGSTFTPAGQAGYTYRRLNTATLPSTTWNPADWTSLDPEDYSNIGTYAMTVSNYQYSIDNGPFQSSTTFTGVTPGTHPLVVRDVLTGCESEPVDVEIDAVGAITPVVDFTYATPVCQISTTNPLPILGAGFTAGGTFTSNPAANIDINPTTGEITLVNTTDGTYDITYSIPFDPLTCQAAGSRTFTIVISPATPANVTFSYTSPVCQIAQATLAPTLDAGFVAGGTFTINPTTGVAIDPATGVLTLGATATAGTYNVTYTLAQDVATCRAATTSSAIQVVIDPVTNANVTFSYPTPVCSIAQATVAPILDPAFTTGGTFTANPSTGIAINASTGVITLGTSTTPGTYSITYSVPQNLATCQALTTSPAIQIVIDPATTPTVGFSYTSPVCPGETVNPMPVLGAGFTTGGVFGPTPLVDPITGEVDLDQTTAGTTYQITYTVAANNAACQNGNVGNASIAISSPILVELSGGCQNVYVLNATPVNGSFDPATATYQWYNAQGPVLNGDQQSLDVPVIGTYTVVVTYNGCQVTSAPFEVLSIACQIQRGISANNDNFNDTFNLTGFDVKHLTIFNRMGMKVYSRGNYVNEWDGKSDDGDELPDGTYFYVIERNTGGDLTGWVYINRAQ
ncbi:fibronectin type III domain-containing protein [Flavobacterium wongokense]|uniref:fibronectin type III domain-containing protein n=1 Tax=Flavobacterium wongokense TaxID=2910674 RepID=UPI001F3C8C68|nr:fibronectin type III domain-containing protein [Flavobacterium sp. WG47]MCF6131347.1 fibronectin type III domain-containing protein [Flavobacterium sp. WG47]